MLLALVPLLSALLAGTAPAAALAGLGLSGWASVADAMLTSLPEELETLSKLSPVFTKMGVAVKEGSTSQQVAQMAHQWAQENFEASVRLQPGMGGGAAAGNY